MDFLRRLTLQTERDRFRELIPVLSYNEDAKVFLMEGDKDRNYLGCCWLSPPLVGCDDSTTARLESTLSHDFRPGSMMQVVNLNSSYIDHILHTFAGHRKDMRKAANGLSQRQVEVLERLFRAKVKHFESGKTTPLIKENNVLLRDMVSIVTIKVPCEKLPTERDFESVTSAAITVEQGFTTAGMKLERLSRLEYVALTRSILNMGQGVQATADGSRMVRDDIVSYEDYVEVHPDYLDLNGRVVRCLSTQAYPQTASLGYMGNLLGDPMGGSNQISDAFMVCLSIHFPDRVKAKQKIGQKAQTINYQANGPWVRFVPRLRSTKVGFDALTEALDEGSPPVQAWLNTVIFSRDLDTSRRTASSMKTHYQVYGFQMREDRYMGLNTFINSLPLCNSPGLVESADRYTTMAVRHAVNIMPLLGDWKGNGRKGTCMYVSRRGQVMLFDPFDSENNYNMIASASSGSGKSFWCNDLIVGAMSKGAKVRIIDVGRSYLKLTEALEGVFMEFSEASRICLNPFTKIVNLNEEMPILKGVVSKMAAPINGLDDNQLARVEEAIRKLWDEVGSNLNITDLAAYLTQLGEEENDQRIKDIGTQLYPWTRHGTYGAFFDGDNNLTFSNNLIVLELEELSGKPELQQVVLLMLVAEIQREMYLGDRTQPKYVVVDEAWSLLADPVVGKALESFYRRARKYGGSTLIITQNAADCYQTPAGKAMAENAANYIVLKQRAEAVDALQKEGKLSVGEYGFAMMKSVYTLRGAFSEIFLYTDRGWGIGRLVVDRWTQLLYSTAPDEVGPIMKYQRDTRCSIEEAIDWFMAEDAKKQAAA